MKIAVTDANIFIDLINIKLISHFFELKIEAHTTIDVLEELFPHQKEILLAYKSNQKLSVHILTGEELEEMQKFVNSNKLSDADKTVIYLANKIKAIVLSSDGPARKIAKQKKIETHGLIWLFDEFVNSDSLSPQNACSKIKELLNSNKRYREDIKLNEEFDKRLKEWEGQ
jgi:hypothetical protein